MAYCATNESGYERESYGMYSILTQLRVGEPRIHLPLYEPELSPLLNRYPQQLSVLLEDLCESPAGP